MKRMVFFCLALVFAMIAMASAAEIDGKWKASMEGPDGSMQIDFILKADGEILTGTVEGPMGTVPIKNGKIEGNNLYFETEMEGNTITHKGVLSGDKITLSVVEMGTDLICNRVFNTDITGSWVGKVAGPDGEMNFEFIFNVTDGKLTGKVIGPSGVMPITKTKLKMPEFSFDINAGGAILTHKCELVKNKIFVIVEGLQTGMVMTLVRK